MKNLPSKILTLFISVLFLACDSGEPFRIVNISPMYNNIDIDTKITVEFNKIARPSTITSDTFLLLNDKNETLEAEVSYDNTIRTAILKPKLRLKLNSHYTIKLSSAISSYDRSSHIPETISLFDTHKGTWHDPIRVGHEENVRQENPEVALDDQGTAWVVWEQTNAETGYSNIYYNSTFLDDDDGSSAYGGNERLDNENRGNASFPKIAIKPDLYKLEKQEMLRARRLSVVWQQYDGTKTNIWSHKYGIDAWGSRPYSLGGIGRVENGSSRYPQVSMNHEGRVVAVWRDYNSSVSSKSDTIKTSFNPDRSEIWVEAYSRNARGDDISSVQISEAQGDRSMILFQTHLHSINRLIVKDSNDISRQLDSDFANFSFENFSTGDVIASDMATNKQGDTAVIWTKKVNTNSNQNVHAVFIAQYDNNESRWKNVSKQLSSINAGMSKVKISIDSSRNIMAVFKAGRTLWFSYYDALTESWSRGQTFISVNIKSFDVKADEAGHYFVTWSERTDSSPHNKIFVRTFSKGIPVRSKQLSQDDMGKASNPKLSINSLGFAIVVWEQLDENRVSHLFSSSFE